MGYGSGAGVPGQLRSSVRSGSAGAAVRVGLPGAGKRGAMGSIGWYIFRTTLSAFWLICGSLTLIVWLDSAVRDLDLMTSQGQTIMPFLGLMSLAIPQLILIISPIAFMIAAAHTLNRLATDSELIVLNAAGVSPWRLFRSFMAAD